VTLSLRKSVIFLLAVCCSVGFALEAQCLEQEQEAASIHPPERGEVNLGQFKATSPPPVVIPFNRYLSLLVTDLDTVNEISFAEVMDKLASYASNKPFAKEMLFHEWWDTANQHPGLLLGPHCDDVPPTDPTKDFPYTCPRQQDGNEARNTLMFTTDPLDGYSAIAFSNRFDLLSPAVPSSVSGKVVYPDCGEYRIIFARNSGQTRPPIDPDTKRPGPFDSNAQLMARGDIFNRNLISFEARIKNPDPKSQDANDVPVGCLPILRFWYSLSKDSMSAAARGKALHDFFMTGSLGEFGSIPAVIDAANFTSESGQIRTNQFLNNVTNKPAVPPSGYNPGIPGSTTVTPNDWLLREFRVQTGIDKDQRTKLSIVIDTTKSTPGSFLFKTLAAGATPDPRTVPLIWEIRSQIAALLGGETSSGQYPNTKDINAIRFMPSKQRADAYQSDEGSPCKASCSQNNEGDIVSAFDSNVNLSIDIQDDLIAVNAANLKPTPFIAGNVVDRIRTQTCAGCHQFSDTKITSGGITLGFDPPGGLGGGAQWPTKACGDFGNCLPPAVGPNGSNTGFVVTSTSHHPPMQFTQVSEVTLTPSIADGGNGWRYAISSTAECMLDYREQFMQAALGLTPTVGNSCP
jgi:hypothetical protein